MMKKITNVIRDPYITFHTPYHTVNPSNIDNTDNETLTYEPDDTLYNLTCIENDIPKKYVPSHNNKLISPGTVYMGKNNKISNSMICSNGYINPTKINKCPPGYYYNNIKNTKNGCNKHFRECVSARIPQRTLYMGKDNIAYSTMDCNNGYRNPTKLNKCPPGYYYKNIKNTENGCNRHFRECVKSVPYLKRIEQMSNGMVNGIKNITTDSINTIKSIL